MTDSERLARIERRLDELHEGFANFRVAVEGRVSRLEAKAAVWGTIGGVGVALLMKVIR